VRAVIPLRRAKGTVLRLPSFSVPTPLHLAFAEVWRNKGRFFLISTVVAFITLLVLFTAGLAEGLGLGNREYLVQARGDLIAYSDKSELLIPASRLTEAKLRDLRAAPGVRAVGAVAWTSANVQRSGERGDLKVQIGGVIPGEAGEPRVLDGSALFNRRGREALIDRSTQLRTGLNVGDVLNIKSTVGDRDVVYALTVVGVTGSEQYSLQPTVFVGDETWEQLRPRADVPVDFTQTVYNIAFVELDEPARAAEIALLVERAAKRVQLVDATTAYQNTPGYDAQQSTLGLQRAFTLIIGLIVVASFFRIQTLQKVAQVGVLKAIGTPAWAIVTAAMAQIFSVNAFGVVLGVLATLGLAAVIPGEVPIRFDGDTFVSTTLLMLLIGPLGGLVSIQILLKTEPLKALGLAS
jgi:putative ABC transport system permease protein